MYQYHNNLLSIPARLLYENWALMSYKNYNLKCHRGQLVRTRHGKGNEAWVSFYDLPYDIKTVCIANLGSQENFIVNGLEPHILPDIEAAKYYNSHRTPSGKPLSEGKKRGKLTNVMILNAIKTVFIDSKKYRKKGAKVWTNIKIAVNALNTNKWQHSLPGNERSLQRRYKRYLTEGYATFIHKNEGSENALKIKDEISDFLLAQYCLPIKLTIPEVLLCYDIERIKKGWTPLGGF